MSSTTMGMRGTAAPGCTRTAPRRFRSRAALSSRCWRWVASRRSRTSASANPRRSPQCPRQQLGLVVSALPPPGRVKRHRDQDRPRSGDRENAPQRRGRRDGQRLTRARRTRVFEPTQGATQGTVERERPNGHREGVAERHARIGRDELAPLGRGERRQARPTHHGTCAAAGGAGRRKGEVQERPERHRYQSRTTSGTGGLRPAYGPAVVARQHLPGPKY